MKTDWKCIVVFAIVLVLSASLLVPMAAARGDEGHREGHGGRGELHERGFGHGEGIRGFDSRGIAWHGGGWDRWGGWYRGGAYPYAYNYPATYVIFSPAYYGGDQGACYQACVNSWQYSPAQCGQMCYYA